MKRIITFILVMCMMLSVIPVAHAEGESTGSGITVVYDLASKVGKWNSTTEPFSDLKEEGLWEYAGNSAGIDYPSAGTLNYMLGNGLYIGKGGVWFALKITVPNDGTYTPSVNFGAAYQGDFKVYLIPAADNAEFSASDMTSDNVIGSVALSSAYNKSGAFTDDNGNPYVHEFTEKELTAGQYYLVYQTTRSNKPAYVGNFTLYCAESGSDVSLQEPTVSITPESIRVGETATLTATVNYSDGSPCEDAEFSYTSLNEYATVTTDGVVTGAAAGTAEIKVTATKDGLSSETTITLVVSEPLSLKEPTVSVTPESIKVGETATLTATVNYSDESLCEDAKFSYTSLNDYATVTTDGVVTGVAAGTAEIKVTATKGDLSSETTITLDVKAADPVISGDTLVYDIASKVGGWNSTTEAFSDLEGDLWVYAGNSAGIDYPSAGTLNYMPGNGLYIGKGGVWFALKITVPNDGTYTPSVNFGAGYNYNFKVYLIPAADNEEFNGSGMASENEIGSVTLGSAYSSYDKDFTDDAGNPFVREFTEKELTAGQYYLVYQTTGSKPAYVGNFTLTKKSVPGVAEYDGVEYATLQAAIDAATAGGTITLLDNNTAGDVVVSSGITLDLNGCTLEATSFTAFNGANVVDDSSDKAGVLKVSGNCTLAAGNNQMPVYNGTDGYVFATMKEQAQNNTVAGSGEFNLVFRPSFGSTFNSMLANGEDATEVQVLLLLEWKDANGNPKSQTLKYKNDQVIDVYGNTRAFSVKITGVENFDNLTITPQVKSSNRGVIWQKSTFAAVSE